MPIASYPPSLTFRPLARTPDATVAVPGSKSITNRALLAAGLAQGDSILIGALDADDTRRMTECLSALGVSIEAAGDNLRIAGTGGRFAAPQTSLFVGNSGTTIRFLTAAAPLAPEGASVVLDGVERMRARPIRDLIDAMVQLGCRAAYLGAAGCPPVRVAGGGLKGGCCTVRGDVSSQYLSALLLTAPAAAQDTRIQIAGDLASRPYVDLTAAVMESFGARIESQSPADLLVPARLGYRGRAYVVEPDASNAAYFLAAAALAEGKVTVNGIGSASLQGDSRFVDVLQAMGCQVSQEETSTTVIGPAQLQAIDCDMRAIPDTAQTAAVLALFAAGKSRLTGLETLRVKETDRIEALATELSKLGAAVEAADDALTISPPAAVSAAAIDTYDDHRMAMSFALAGLREPKIVINDPGCVAKTFPDFWFRWNGVFENVAN